MLHQIYQRLPPAGRHIAVALRGYHLRSWRYGPETERLVEEAIAREQWDSDRWRQYQEERLAFVLDRAATAVPYYRQLWAERRRRGDRRPWDRLEHWPILDKETLRRTPAAFVADDCDLRRMFHEHTSGTSGTPLDLWWSQRTVREWYALWEARARRWHGVSREDRWAILGGQLVVPVTYRRPPFWVWNRALRQLYLSSYHLSQEAIPHYVDALRRYRVTHLVGYSSALHALAEEALRCPAGGLDLQVVITNAEPLFDHQRAAIGRTFACPVRETYGMAELVAAASECEAGRLHLWPEVGRVEILDEGSPATPGRSGELVCTGLFNADMPLIRYRVGDSATASSDVARCACGRGLPALGAVEGRLDDLVYARDGRPVGRLDPVFKSRLPIKEAQIIQERLDRIRVRYVPAPEFSAATGAEVAQRLRDRLGDVDVVMEAVDRVPRTAGGKMRGVICALSAEERHAVARV